MPGPSSNSPPQGGARYSPEQSKVPERIREKWDAMMADSDAVIVASVVVLSVNLDATGKVTSIEVKKSTAPQHLVEICKKAVNESAPFDLKGTTSFDFTFNYLAP